MSWPGVALSCAPDGRHATLLLDAAVTHWRIEDGRIRPLVTTSGTPAHHLAWHPREPVLAVVSYNHVEFETVDLSSVAPTATDPPPRLLAPGRWRCSPTAWSSPT